MATSIFGTVLPGAVGETRRAGATITIGQIVKMAADGDLIPAAAATDQPYGVAASPAAADGDEFTVVVAGPCMVQSAALDYASVTNLLCASDASGRATTAGTAGNVIAVRVLPDYTQLNYAAGDLIFAVIASGFKN